MGVGSAGGLAVVGEGEAARVGVVGEYGKDGVPALVEVLY